MITHLTDDMKDELDSLLSNAHSHDEIAPEQTPTTAVRKFVEFRKKGENTLNSNLTELNAAHAVEKGFVTHNDWIAHTLRYAYAAKHIMRTKAQTVLDVGCGNLQLPYFCWRNRVPGIKQYVGVDLRAQSKWLGEVGWGTPMSLVRADIVLDTEALDHKFAETILGKGVSGNFNGFDTTICFEAFEHVPNEDKPALMQNLFHWTRPGGYCLFSTPNAGVSESTAHNHTDPVTGESREWSFRQKLELALSVGFTLEAKYGTFCGTTRIPGHKELLEENPILSAAKAFLPHGWYTCVIAAAYPEESNNSLFVLRKPE